MAIAACFVFQREISRSVFWDFFDSIDPLQTWGRGERYPYAEHRSNMNVINISAKKSET
jgi:hypothetical protein